MRGKTDAAAPVLVGIAVGLISLGRLWLGNHDALLDVVWAEDGVFPLCIVKAGFPSCVVDPFAGYLLVLPRLLAGVVVLFPAASWGLVTNLLAALVVGIVGALAFTIARRAGMASTAALGIGLIPVALPIVGLEAINALGSTYMLLLYLLVIVLALPGRREWTRGQAVWIAFLLLLSALTIPTAGIALILIAVQVMRRVLPLGRAITWSIAVLVGLLAQWVTAVGAAKPRAIEPGVESLQQWIDAVPTSILTLVPGLSFGTVEWDTNFTLEPSAFTALIIVLALAATGLVLMFRRDAGLAAVGMLLVSGIVIGAVPSIIGAPNNRYFVVPIMLWSAAGVIAAEPWMRRRSPVTLLAIATVVLVIWWPLVPASWFRSTPAPPWQGEIARIEAACTADPQKPERVVFTPYWPPNWGDALAEPTHPDISCFDVWTWMGITSQK